MPVVTPVRASIASQKAVPYCEVFSALMGPRRRWSRRSSVMVRQTRPRPYFAMKLMASGVTFSAARVMSPSFSRSSSSTTTIMRPARISLIAVGTSAKACALMIDSLLPGPLRAVSPRQILLIERLANESLNHCLTADIQFLSGPVQLFQHAGREIHVHPLDWTHHLTLVGEEPGHVPAAVGEPRNGFCGCCFSLLMSALHKVAAPAWWPSRESRGGSTLLARPRAPRRSRSTGRLQPSRWRDTVRGSPSAGRDSKNEQRVPALPRIRFPVSDWPLNAHSCGHQNQIA